MSPSTLRQAMLNERSAQLSTLVVLAHTSLEKLHAQEKAGELTREEAQREARKLIGSLRKDELYFFVRGYTNDVNQMHPNPQRVGIVDAKGGKEAGERYRAALAGKTVATLTAYGIGGLGWGMSRTLYRQLGGEPTYAATVVRQIGAGDLGMTVKLRAGDCTSLLHAMHHMQQSLAQTVRIIRGSTDSIATASQEIASGNHDLSSRTEQQASPLEETAASMEELTGTVKQNADNARQAHQLARGDLRGDRQHCLSDEYLGFECSSRSCMKQERPWRRSLRASAE